jgi:hypothetical protein
MAQARRLMEGKITLKKKDAEAHPDLGVHFQA